MKSCPPAGSIDKIMSGPPRREHAGGMTASDRRASLLPMAKKFWQGALRIEGETAWWSGSIGDAVAHRHFAAQAVFSQTPVQAIDGNDQLLSGTCLLIEPDARHQLRPAARAEICFVEPTSAFGPPDTLRDRIKAGRYQIVYGAAARPFWQNWMMRVPRRSIDPRISNMIGTIEPRLPLGTVRLGDVAAGTRLSVGRLRHLFASEIGMPFQRYILWRRLNAAFGALLAGANITEAAHAAGFADAAHFARTIKAMFGIRASDIFLER